MASFTHVLAVVAVIIPSAVVLCGIVWAVYNIYFHPLRGYPGPKLWAASRVPFCYHDIKGDIVYATKRLHDMYGPVVRLGPDQLSYTSAEAWRTIYGQRSNEMEKSLAGHAHIIPPNRAHTLLTAPTKKEHREKRRALSHAFTDSSLRAQEHYFQHYVGQLISRLDEISREGGGPVDIVKCYNAATFDAIGDLAFGEPFDCVKTLELHPFVANIFNNFKIMPVIRAIQYHGLLRFLPYLVPHHLQKSQADLAAIGNDKLSRRIAKGIANDRGDFMSFVLTKLDGVKDRAELENLTIILLVGGSETTATLLSGATYYLLHNYQTYEKLKREIRSSFTTEDEITLNRVANLPYLRAVIDEALRIYPPTPTSFPRIVPGKGEMIQGRFVPGGVAVGVSPFSAAHSEQNFADASKFVPERYCPASAEDKLKYSNDVFDAAQPFSVGPRNCIGRSMAYAEMNLILSRVVWNFDLEAVPGQESWIHQTASTVWEKGSLMVSIKRRPGSTKAT